MLTTRLRKQIEWHFKNYKADLAMYEEKVKDICDSGLTTHLDRVGSSSQPGNPTLRKAMQIEALEHQKNWATVIRNVFNAFRFEPEYEIMEALYIQGTPYRKVISEGLWENTFFRWRDKWLELAYKWAKEFHLL